MLLARQGAEAVFDGTIFAWVKPYDFGVMLAVLVFLVIGVVSGTHKRTFDAQECMVYSHAERKMLHLPSVWLSASLWLNYCNNVLFAIAIISSVVVVLLPVFEPERDYAFDVRVVIYTLASLSCTLLNNFTHAKEKSIGYRKAHDLFVPYCELYEFSYGPKADGTFIANDNSNRKASFDVLAIKHDEAEAIIRAAHTYNANKRKTFLETDRIGEGAGDASILERLVEQWRSTLDCDRETIEPRMMSTCSWLRAIAYYVYPRPGDLLKAAFIVFGALIAVASVGEPRASLWEIVAATAFVFFVFDFLLYQARYQINDIRGFEEDLLNPEAGKRSRLPVIEGLGIGTSMMVSLSVASARLVAAAVVLGLLVAQKGWGMAFSLLACCVAAVLLAVLYEGARDRSKNIWDVEVGRYPELLQAGSPVPQAVLQALRKATAPVFALVCLGYPLRLLAGYLFVADVAGTASYAGFWLAFVLVLAATACFGESFVTLTWALEASRLKRQIDTGEKNYDGTLKRFYKPNIALMSYALGPSVSEAFSLRSCSPAMRRWNVSMFSVVVLLSAAILLTVPWGSAWTGSLSWPSLVYPCIVIGSFLAFLLAVRFQKLMTLWLVVMSVFDVTMVGIWVVAEPTFDVASVMSLMLMSYMAIYLSFRNTNYEGMHGKLLVKLVESCADGVVSLFRKVVGQSAFYHIEQRSSGWQKGPRLHDTIAAAEEREAPIGLEDGESAANMQ